MRDRIDANNDGAAPLDWAAVSHPATGCYVCRIHGGELISNGHIVCAGA